MSAIKADVIREAYVMEVDEYSLISTSDVIKVNNCACVIHPIIILYQKFDLTRVKQSQLNFEASFTLTMQRNAQCHASSFAYLYNYNILHLNRRSLGTLTSASRCPTIVSTSAPARKTHPHTGNKPCSF